jgi:hypothetical protein
MARYELRDAVDFALADGSAVTVERGAFIHFDGEPHQRMRSVPGSSPRSRDDSWREHELAKMSGTINRDRVVQVGQRVVSEDEQRKGLPAGIMPW